MRIVCSLVVLALVGGLPTQTGSAAGRRPLVLVRAASILDARGHARGRFVGGEIIALRIEWSVRNATPGSRQTVDWTVRYLGHAVLHRVSTDVARNGDWSRIIRVVVGATPHDGVHVFWGQVRVDAALSMRSVAFTIGK